MHLDAPLINVWDIGGSQGKVFAPKQKQSKHGTGGLMVTVGELIKMLKEFDEEKEVYDDNGFPIEDVTEDDEGGVYIE